MTTSFKGKKIKKQTSRNVSITADYIDKGLSQRDIAKRHGLSQQHVSRILNSDDLKECRDRSVARQFKLLDLADEVVERHLNDKSPAGKSLDAAKLVHKNTGITPSHTQNVHIDKIVQQNLQINESTEIDGLQEFMKWRFSEDNAMIDVEPAGGKDAD